MINLLPYEKKHTIKRIQLLRVVTVTLVFAGCIGLVALVLMIPTYVDVSMRNTIANAEYATLEQGGVVANDTEIQTAEQNIALLKRAFGPGQFSVLDSLAALAALQPKGITITRITMESIADKSIELSGISASRTVLQTFVDQLQGSGFIASVDNPVSNFVKDTNGEFKITVQFK